MFLNGSDMALRVYLVFLWCFDFISGAVLAPSWADPALNPCALLPQGWQMLYWPPDGKCYKIFKMGYPCPPSMELTPGKVGSDSGATCRCPPKTIRAYNSNICYPIFSRGPCLPGEYFAPNPSKPGIEYKLGKCLHPSECPDPTQIFWPADGKCYRKFSKGPCSLGSILTIGITGIANCTCNVIDGHYWNEDGRCYEYYTKGPCRPGQMFLPGGSCGCSSDLPQYHFSTKLCYEIGSIGPCNHGHRYSLSIESPKRAQCRCKPNYAVWTDGSCYRLYTQGPCNAKELFTPPSRCLPLPCRRSRLYFPDEKRCYKVGSQGPCKAGQVVIFDFEARPSIDGVAYNGVCGCVGLLSIDKPNACNETRMVDDDCSTMPGMRIVDGMCHMLYTKGPCKDGEWLVPKSNSTSTECSCKPGFTKSEDEIGNVCLHPTVTLAKYLNENYTVGR